MKNNYTRTRSHWIGMLSSKERDDNASLLTHHKTAPRLHLSDAF